MVLSAHRYRSLSLLAVGLWWTSNLIGTPRVSAAETEAYQHLAERMDLYFTGEQPRLIESYATPYPPGPDGTLERVTFTYDNALAAMLLVNRGTSDDLRRAKLICDALLWYQQRDPFADGRLRQAYRADQNLLAEATPRSPNGFYNSYTGDMAWAGLAWLTYYERTRAKTYLDAAIKTANVLVERLRELSGRGFYHGLIEREVTVGVPLSRYARLTSATQTVSIPLKEFRSQGLDLKRLRAFSLVFNRTPKVGTITFRDIKLWNSSTKASRLIDDFSDAIPLRNSLGFEIGGIVDIWTHPSGKVITWNSADGTIDWWYSLLADLKDTSRLDGSGYTHLVLGLAGGVGGEDFTVELQGFRFPPTPDKARSTEENLAVYVFFKRLFGLTGESRWDKYGGEAANLVKGTLWDATTKRFYAGLFASRTVDRVHLVEDAQSLALLSLGNINRYGAALDWADRTLGWSSDGFTGFDFGFDSTKEARPDGVWFEGTAHMTCAYQVSRVYGGVDFSAFYLNELGRAQQGAMNTNGKGLVAASHHGVTTGFPNFSYYASSHIGATAWYLAALRHYNPLWNTSTETCVPYDPTCAP